VEAGADLVSSIDGGFPRRDSPQTFRRQQVLQIFGDGISIEKLSPILWDTSIAKGYVSHHDREYMSEDRYWLCARAEAQNEYDEAAQELFGKARHAAYALQIICPCGAKNLYLQFQRSAEGYDNVGTCRPHETCVALLGKMIHAEQLGLADNFDSIYAGIRRAFTEGHVRIQNPVLLLEHAQQIGNIPLAATMCVMGLDMLFMAGNINPFVGRVGGFLEPNSFVFPPYTLGEAVVHQPAPRVRDVLSDTYLFRNLIAHGHEITKEWREPYSLVTTDGDEINCDSICKVDLMLEATMFLLTAALRRVFIESLFDDVIDEAKWRPKLRHFEHRYKDAGGLEIPKHRHGV
jgi:hypothetical protein